MQKSYDTGAALRGEGAVLVLEGALHPPGVALVRRGEVVAAVDVSREKGPSGGLGAAAAAMLVRPEARRLSAVVVDCGPGSFTGLRVALSFAQGLIAGIPGLAGLGVDAPRVLTFGAGLGFPALVAIPWGRLRVLLAEAGIDGRLRGEVIAREALSGRGAIAGRDVATTAAGASLDFPAGVQAHPLSVSPVAVLAEMVAGGCVPASAWRPLEPVYLVPPDAVLPAPARVASSPAAVTIFGPSRLAALEALLAAAFERPWSRAMVQEELADRDDRRVLGWLDRDGCVGAAIFLRRTGDNLEILNLAVHPDYRRRGLGRLLVQEAIGRARQEGLRQVDLEVSEANVAAVRLYETEGFVPVGSRPRYYPDGSAALLMSLVLRRASEPG
ncbi:MAG: GNAT family N-acetyltransferase [Acidobacteriota bacterium]|nr:GNAT family N-acetyltransferase [Acidobacteriota bacterium]